MKEYKIVDKEIKSYIRHAYCNKCGGELKSTGLRLTSNPPQYPHVCKSCDDEIIIRGHRYPTKVYKEIENEQ